MAQAPSWDRQSSFEQSNDLGGFQRPKRVHFGARQQRRNDLKRWIFGRRADQDHVTPLHIGQKCILLRLVEAMDLVDKQQRLSAQAACAFGIGHYRFDLFDPAQYGAKGDELSAALSGNEYRQTGFPGAWGPPQDQRGKLAALDLRPQRLARADQMLLAQEFLERPRAHAVRKGARKLILNIQTRLQAFKQAHIGLSSFALQPQTARWSKLPPR